MHSVKLATTSCDGSQSSNLAAVLINEQPFDCSHVVSLRYTMAVRLNLYAYNNALICMQVRLIYFGGVIGRMSDDRRVSNVIGFDASCYCCCCCCHWRCPAAVLADFLYTGGKRTSIHCCSLFEGPKTFDADHSADGCLLQFSPVRRKKQSTYSFVLGVGGRRIKMNCLLRQFVEHHVL
jgi:hypothetical protein